MGRHSSTVDNRIFIHHISYSINLLVINRISPFILVLTPVLTPGVFPSTRNKLPRPQVKNNLFFNCGTQRTYLVHHRVRRPSHYCKILGNQN